MAKPIDREKLFKLLGIKPKWEFKQHEYVTTDWLAIPTMHNKQGWIVTRRPVGFSEQTRGFEYLVSFNVEHMYWIPGQYLHKIGN